MLGCLALFLWGMNLMSSSLQKFAGNGLRSFIEKMTSNTGKCLFTGFLVTVLVQSSTATTLMLVSFVNAGLMTLRSAIGVIAMLRQLPGVVLDPLIDTALASYEDQGIDFDVAEVGAKVRAFFSGRLAAIAKDEGADPDTIQAVVDTRICDPQAFLGRVSALDRARRESREVFDDLATAYARASHLADAKLGTDVDEGQLGDAERALLAAVDKGTAVVTDHIARGALDEAIASLASLREPIDRFFDDVLVMDPDEALRNNRLRLLNRFEQAFAGVANIGALAKRK